MASQKKTCCTANRAPSEKNRQPTQKIRVKTPEKSYKGMVRLTGGEFLMGTDDPIGFPDDGEGPVRKVKIDPFWIDITAVTNRQFDLFIKQTGYNTEAESYGWTFVFYQFVSKNIDHYVRQSVAETPWWLVVEGADWQHPEGPDTTIKHRMDHPVVHISWNDAKAFCQWAGKRPPSEAEWEFAARGGLEQKRFAWGDELTPNGIHQCNIWQGHFPNHNTKEDGFAGIAPARSFPPNGYGLFNVSGNVWEWCEDWFSTNFSIEGMENNPKGPRHGEKKVIRGGSYLCHESYCNRYRVAARSSNTPDSSTGNLGFRCARGI